MNFEVFKIAVQKQFAAMQLMKTGIFVTRKDDRNELVDVYLNAFPEGSNPIHRERTEHDCNCCKQFIRTMGNVVSIGADGKLVSIWDVTLKNEPEYQIVANALAEHVRKKPITDFFLHYENRVGTSENFELIDAKPVKHHHFAVQLPAELVARKDSIPSRLNDYRTKVVAFQRSLNDLSIESVETVLELITGNSLYRGDEHKFAVSEFLKVRKQYEKLSADKRATFAWLQVAQGKVPDSVLHFRGSVIGTLVEDVEAGTDLEDAVKKFEAKVAPANYKRPTAVVTARMVEDAKKTIIALGLETALDRRYAALSDISINNILFADRSIKKDLSDSDDVFAGIASATVKTPKNLDKVETITYEKFVKDIVPTAKNIEMLLSNQHKTKMVSLVAPVDATAPNMFKWDNGFSWSYAGDFADAIKERVKNAGGSVTGELCCRLAWYSPTDLDFYMLEPHGNTIYFGRKVSAKTGGNLDVDMNAWGPSSDTEPVENIVYPSIRKMPNGVYTLKVNTYSVRKGPKNFDIEIDILGETHRASFAEHARGGNDMTVAKLTVKDGVVTIQGDSMVASRQSQKLWNLDTENFQRVNVLMNSPNHWDGQGVGNKHVFFMLDGCVNEESARGFFNEYLREDLNKHRKVLEIVGSKKRTQETENQLSGVGFSLTGKNEVIVKVTGSITRMFKVII